MKEKPAFATDEHLKYLDDIRESGITNMFAAAPYLQWEFSIPGKEAREVLSYWMESFSERHSETNRI